MSGAPVTESEFQRAVIELAHLRGFLVAHFRATKTATGRHLTPVAADGAGFVDLVLCGRGRIMFRELKTDRGRLTAPQRRWGELICAAGGDWDVWRPRDWTRIEEQLRARGAA